MVIVAYRDHSANVEIIIIDLLEAKAVLVGQVQQRQEAQRRRDVLVLPVARVEGLEGGARVDQVLHLLLRVRYRYLLATHVHLCCLGDLDYYLRVLFESQRIFLT